MKNASAASIARKNIVFPDDNNRLEFQEKARKARSPSPKDVLYRGEGVTLVHPEKKGVLNLCHSRRGLNFFSLSGTVTFFVSCVLFGSLQVPPRSSVATSCAPRSLIVIAVDELDTMHLEADLTDAIVSADAASVINNVLLRSRLLQQLPWGKGCRTIGSSTPPGKEPG